ncbi:hypothetical protein [Mycolicibacterium fallax]|uniref:Uncharacterized protein n=1 Tax=Mycolicibacterium fallax TaxID=1793 RepID=A0A1X1RJ40_MYCFA|nr:hypothetical protein [Mycolicibacterium fallax]MCB0929857.1 hypothetical protein [Mycobacterium sp.]ORV07550.1 hypothetical protein AWC04_03820 [Mycolicibacterium fallax]BBY99465.1 hypothetical protein MFAL_29320 [Mycolicibacterium fallax]HRC61768.1 hypothetical protein [Dehalococcoidia bacterium]
MTTFLPVPLSPSEDLDPITPTLQQVVGVGDPSAAGAGALDRVAAHLAQLGGHVPAGPWYADVSPGAVTALVAITVLLLLIAALVGYGVHQSWSAR